MKKQRHQILVGLFVLIGLIIIASAIYYVGQRQVLFGDKVKVTAVFENVAGLQPGNNVRYSGIKIGTVESIEIESDSTVIVELTIENSASRFIKKDATATIESVGLMGNKVVSIKPGSDNSQSISSGDQLLSKDPMALKDVMKSIQQTSNSAAALAKNLNDITIQIKNAKGTLGKLVADTTMARKVEKAIVSLSKTSKNASEITQEIKRGEGLMNEMVYNEKWTRDVKSTLDSVESAGSRLNKTSKQLYAFSKRLNEGDGTINKLVNDSSMAKELEQLIKNIERGTKDMDEAVETVNKSWLLNLFSNNKKD